MATIEKTVNVDVDVSIDIDDHIDDILASLFGMDEREIRRAIDFMEHCDDQQKERIIAECENIKLPPDLHDFLCTIFGKVHIGL